LEVKHFHLEKLGYYKVSQQEFGFRNPVGITKGKDQVVDTENN
jgi:hypothetical protein